MIDGAREFAGEYGIEEDVAVKAISTFNSGVSVTETCDMYGLDPHTFSKLYRRIKDHVAGIFFCQDA